MGLEFLKVFDSGSCPLNRPFFRTIFNILKSNFQINDRISSFCSFDSYLFVLRTKAIDVTIIKMKNEPIAII